MIEKGTRLEVCPYAIYKDKPEKNQDILVSEDSKGTYQAFQVMDKNTSTSQKKGYSTGFCYLRVRSNLPLKVKDMITIDKIEAVQVKDMFRKQVVITCTIQETSPYEPQESNSEEVESYGF